MLHLSDVILITYGDMVRRAGEDPLATLHAFLLATIKPSINTVHILPFYPYSSDDGFSVIDYYAVDPHLGDWADIHALRQDFNLMFDAVFNHISAQSAWFQAFLRDEAPYTDYFTVVDPSVDLSQVVRPRTLPLLTPFETPSGTKHVWTTFSPDQIDLNFANRAVLIEMIRVLLFYVQQGASLIRLDAIAFVWKQIGTSCIHLPQAHRIVQTMRAVLDQVAPEVLLVTETNVPHAENVAYFGDGYNEAQMVYQFPLPPLILHTLHTGDATRLTQWAASLARVSPQTTFFNFTASHDGIGMRPVSGILSKAEIQALVDLTVAHGGRVSYRSLPDGTQEPYELNITYFDAITSPDADEDTAVRRFMVSQAIMLALMGVPGIYFHNLFGSRNDLNGVNAMPADAPPNERNRRINRQKFDADDVLTALKNPDSLRSKVFHAYTQLLNIRTTQPAFHPLGDQVVLQLSAAVFAVERITSEQRVLALHNVTGETVRCDFDGTGQELLTNTVYHQQIILAPYQIAWLRLLQPDGKG